MSLQDSVQCEGRPPAQGAGVLSWQRQHLDQVTCKCFTFGQYLDLEVPDRGQQWSVHGFSVQGPEHPQVGVTLSMGTWAANEMVNELISRAGHLGEARSEREGSTIVQKTHHRSLYIDRYQVLNMY